MKLHDVPFIAAPSTAALLQRNPASAGTSRSNCGGHFTNQNNEVYKKVWYVIFRFICDL
jgi:hypothetical protein